MRKAKYLGMQISFNIAVTKQAAKASINRNMMAIRKKLKWASP